MTIPIILGVGAVLVVVLLLMGKRRPDDGADRPYVRVEGAEILAFYEPYTPFLAKTPTDIAAFVELLAEKTGLPLAADEYPVDEASIRLAVAALVEASAARFGVELSVASPDAAQLDRLVNAHLVDPGLRPFLAAGGLRDDLSEAETAACEQALTELRIPHEPLLYYCLGCFWGEWLSRHRQATWTLVAPLRPIQVFPDMITAGITACLHPFSQVVKKMSDPEGDQLAFKAAGITRRYFPPFPLLVSLADAEHAAQSLLPAPAREARRQEDAGNMSAALVCYAEALALSPDAPGLHALAAQCAWRAEDWTRAEAWLRAGLALSPEHPVLCYNLGALLAGRTEGHTEEAVRLLQAAVAVSPHYGRARLALASLYAQTGEAGQALAEARLVQENDTELQEAAAELIASLLPDDESPSAAVP